MTSSALRTAIIPDIRYSLRLLSRIVFLAKVASSELNEYIAGQFWETILHWRHIVNSDECLNKNMISTCTEINFTTSRSYLKHSCLPNTQWDSQFCFVKKSRVPLTAKCPIWLNHTIFIQNTKSMLYMPIQNRHCPWLMFPISSRCGITYYHHFCRLNEKVLT